MSRGAGLCISLMACAVWVHAGQAEPALNDEQRGAVGIRIGHPVPLTVPDRLEALGTVLDSAQVVAEAGELQAAKAAEHYAAAEVARLRRLYEAGAAASQKMLEAAVLDLAKAQTQSRALAAQFAQRWGPLSSSAPAPGALLVRAEVLGRHSLGGLPTKALLRVDGMDVAGRVLGLLHGAAEQQGVSVLIEVRGAPAGLGVGARLPVVLLAAVQSGTLLPREALLYDEHGPYVYKQLARKAGEKLTHFSPVKVTLLLTYGDGWLVTGVDSNDDIVVHGAGVLWSLQENGERAVDDDVD